MSDFTITPGEGTFKVTRANKLTVEKKQFEKKYEISFRWYREDGRDILAIHEDDLSLHAWILIMEAREHGYIEGELARQRICHRGEIIDYRGWWELKEITQ